VHVLGFRRDVPDVLAAFDVFVLPSLAESEAFPNTLVEAMASGLPCVASDVSSVDEILIDGANGLLVKPGDSAALAATLQRLVGDPELRERLGAEARARVEREFSLETKVTELERYLDRMRARRRPRAS
jgi:glycosyltransferase involved in cell wall biosynthesis